MSAEEALEILRKSQPPVLKIDRRGEPELGKPTENDELE